MQSCPVCGRSFDPLGFQVVVPELGGGFCRIDCAQNARAAGPAARLAVAPLAAVPGRRMAAALAPATAAVAARSLPPAAAPLGLLVAGTAAAIVLWARVLGADPTHFTLGPLSPPPAFGRETVQAEVAPKQGPARSPLAQNGRPQAATTQGVAFTASAPAPAPTQPAVDPSTPEPPSPSPPTPTEPQPQEPTGNGHSGHGNGRDDDDDDCRGSGHGNGEDDGEDEDHGEHDVEHGHEDDDDDDHDGHDGHHGEDHGHDGDGDDDDHEGHHGDHGEHRGHQDDGDEHGHEDDGKGKD
jgi:hypothetical protein